MVDDYRAAAIRHIKDAQALAAGGRYDNAGHLIGFGAECLLKQKLRSLRNEPQANYDGHHPDPQRRVRRELEYRRLSGPWLAIMRKTTIFQDWHISDRYSADGVVTKEKYDTWEKVTMNLLSISKIR